MKMKICTVYDSKAEAYMRPFFEQSTGTAVRAFTEECNNPKSVLSSHPSDYTLMEIGEFDDQSGEVSKYEAKKSLGLAIEYKRKQQVPSHDALDANPLPS
jgi:alkyl hydroperoxide reductase subunit AhpC